MENQGLNNLFTEDDELVNSKESLEVNLSCVNTEKAQSNQELENLYKLSDA